MSELNQFNHFRSQKLNVNRVAMLSVMIAFQIILKRFSFGTNWFQISFVFLAIFLTGKWFGPLWSAIGCGISDVLGAILNGIAFFPGFTLSTMVTGWIEGVFFFRRPVSWPRLIVSQVLVVFLVDALMNTTWLVMMYGMNFKVALLTRLPKEIIIAPVWIVLLHWLGNLRGIKLLTSRYFR